MESTARRNTFAAVEGFLAFMACMYAFAAMKSSIHTLNLAPRAFIHASGLAQCLSAVAVLVGVYGKRLRPNLSFAAAAGSVSSSLTHCFRLSLSPLSCFLLVAIATQCAATVWVTPGYVGMLAHTHGVLPCGDATQLVWAPIFEELAFRVVVFSLVLQRTGGDVRTTVLITVGLFAGVHIPNAFSAWASAQAAPRSYVALQVLAAVAVGSYLCCAYALSGSVVEVSLLHAANNLAALVWIGRDAVLSAGKGDGHSDHAGQCRPQVTGELLVGLCAQVALYAVATSVAWGQVQQHTVGLQQVQARVGEGQTTGARANAVPAFKAAHPIVYGGTDGELHRGD